MTLEEMKTSQEYILTPADVAPVLGCNPQSIREQARKNPALLGFHVTVVGKHTLIPRVPFIQFMTQYEAKR